MVIMLPDEAMVRRSQIILEPIRMFFRPRHIFALLMILLTAALPAYAADEAQPDQLPLWELGIGGGIATLPQYMGSDERYTFPAVFPYFIYRGNRLRIDRDGINRKLFGVEGLALNLSLGFGLPVRNNNRARAGMPRLHFNGQLGPKIDWEFARQDDISWTLRLPARAVMDTSGSYLGWLSDPDILIKMRNLDAANKLDMRIQLGLLYGSKRYHDAYYTVLPRYVTASRPAYQSKAGLHSLTMRAAMTYRYSRKLSFFTALRVRDMKVGVIKESPLVRQPWYVSAVFGVVWSIWESDRMMPADND